MRSFRIFQAIFISLFLSTLSLSIYSEDSDYPIATNEIIVGDTIILRQHVGQYNAENLWGMLTPNILYYPEYCPDCRPDTLFSFRTELVHDTIFDFYFAVPFGTLTGIYDLIFMDELVPVKYPVRIYVYTPPYIVLQPEDTTTCAGDSAAFIVTAWGNSNTDINYKWYHNDTIIYESYYGVYRIGNSQLKDTGNYYCVLSNQYGVDTTQDVKLYLHPFPSNPGTPVGPDRFCPDIDSTVYSITSDPFATGYSWHLIPEEAGIIQQNDTSCVIFWDLAFSGIARLYVELISGNCGKNSSDTLEITAPGRSAAPEICIVGVDEQTGKYRIIWEESAYGSAQFFKVYRESNQTDVYLEIGTIYPGELSVFVDSTSAPEVLPHRYKLSYFDSCGDESELSTYHQTMHLLANLGVNNQVNLIWSEYVGIPFQTYNIYRGNHPDSMSLWIRVANTVTSYKDINPPPGFVYYQIEMSNPAGCDPSRKSELDYSSSWSNIEQVHVTGIQELIRYNSLIIFPNPVTEELQIRYKKLFISPTKFTVYNALGENVLEGFIQEESISIDVSSLSPGMYILRLMNDTEVISARFVIRE